MIKLLKVSLILIFLGLKIGYSESFMEWMRSYGLREYIHDVDGGY